MTKSFEIRQLQISRLIYQNLASVMAQIRIVGFENGMVSPTRVRLSKDLKHARVGIRYLDFKDQNNSLSELEIKKLIMLLEEYVPQFQGQLARTLQLRYTPKLKFIYDIYWDEVLQVDATINQLFPQER